MLTIKTILFTLIAYAIIYLYYLIAGTQAQPFQQTEMITIAIASGFGYLTSEIANLLGLFGKKRSQRVYLVLVIMIIAVLTYYFY